MSRHEPHIGDIYASNDYRDINRRRLQAREVTSLNTLAAGFDGSDRMVSRDALDTTAQRGYRLIHCTEEDARASTQWT